MSERPVFVVPDPEEPVTKASKTDWDERRMTVIEHLEDLRRVLIHSLVAWVVGSIVGIAASFWIVKLLTLPLDLAHYQPVVLSPVGAITVYLKVGMLAGLVLALPVIMQRIWWFVSPGMKPSERRYARPLLLSSIALFIVGAVLAYGFAYLGVQMLTRFSGFTGIGYIPVLDNYLGVLMLLIVAFGITFEFPVALVIGSLMGLVSSAKLKRWRKGAYLVIPAVGYMITPGADPITPLPLIIPLLLLYEGSIIVIKRLKR
ncbi:MAG: twin-arginine translocase subunit TatC [Candidatus Dormibacteraeota bacterium]|nr:twin-arginine translocase subunit TatC [Candidatus Dormibacteraeota bacterium]